MRKYYVVLELSDDEWEGKASDLVLWIEAAMNSFDANPNDIEATVYDNLDDFIADHALDALATVADPVD